jgi:hypothetical protein
VAVRILLLAKLIVADRADSMADLIMSLAELML